MTRRTPEQRIAAKRARADREDERRAAFEAERAAWAERYLEAERERYLEAERAALSQAGWIQDAMLKAAAVFPAGARS